jgi:hypothetical protein
LGALVKSETESKDCERSSGPNACALISKEDPKRLKSPEKVVVSVFPLGHATSMWLGTGCLIA